MSTNSREQIERIVRNAIIFKRQHMNPILVDSIVENIVDDVFDSDNWGAIQEYLNERVQDSLPDRR